MSEILIYNAIKCKGCGKVLRSYHRHDYRTHTCTNNPAISLMIDGGLAYQRYGWGNDLPKDQQLEDLAVYVPDGPYALCLTGLIP